MSRLIGHLRPGAIPGILSGELRCVTFGTSYDIVAIRNGDGYVLEATPGPIPDGLKLPWEEE